MAKTFKELFDLRQAPCSILVTNLATGNDSHTDFHYGQINSDTELKNLFDSFDVNEFRVRGANLNGHRMPADNAHVVQGWRVDCDGEFIEETESCVEVTHKPDDDDIWQCTKCGWEGPGKNALGNKTYRVSFNVAGSIVVTASSSDMAEKMVMEGIRGEDSSMMQDIAAILQDHLAHADVSIDEVEEKDDDE